MTTQLPPKGEPGTPERRAYMAAYMRQRREWRREWRAAYKPVRDALTRQLREEDLLGGAGRSRVRGASPQ